MKKSEMLEELEQYIRARFKPKSNPAEEAQMLLKRIENLGMIPPEYDRPIQVFNIEKQFTAKVNEWEPELTTIKEG